MTLKELEIGDIFYNEKDRQKKLFVVRGNPAFNIRYGSPTRVCLELKTKELVSKACKINVVFVRESKFSNAYEGKAINFI
jgi:hypothetical protein